LRHESERRLSDVIVKPLRSLWALLAPTGSLRGLRDLENVSEGPTNSTSTLPTSADTRGDAGSERRVASDLVPPELGESAWLSQGELRR
jgi:hypothetical protein